VPPRPSAAAARTSAGVASEAVARAEGGRDSVLYGRNPIEEAIRAGRRRVRKVWATPSAAKEPWLAAVAVQITDADEIAERAGSDAHQGVCAAVDPYPYADATALLALEAPLLVALDEVQDPQNLGAIARSAECAGAAGLVIPERRSAEVTGAAAKASAGAVEHLPVARVRNLADFLIEAKAAGLWCYGASEHAGRLTTRSTGPAELCSSWAPRGGGSAPRACRVRRADVGPAARPDRVAERQRGSGRGALRGRPATKRLTKVARSG
jgi:23S rRNA (guanosine2251-2'-O)-methyltransferase